MRVGLLRDHACDTHHLPEGHPERPERLARLDEHLRRSGLAGDLVATDSVAPVTPEDVHRVHPPAFVVDLDARVPTEGFAHVDSDTWMSAGTMTAARSAAGCAVHGLDAIIAGDLDRAFCAVRPPGHHAETDTAMGFCFLNSAAIAARRGLEVHGLERIAILDFDVHHGNGTAEIFRDDPRVLVASSFQHPGYPGRGMDATSPNLVFTPLAPGTASAEFRSAIEGAWRPALERHRPQLIIVSAGFDAHREDPLGELCLDDDDYRWITALIVDAANDHAQGRVLSMLEGGYDLDALARSAEAHLAALLAG